MLRVHDFRILSYEVNCIERIIALHTRFYDSDKPIDNVDVIFKGVEGYQFVDDALTNINGNIVLDIPEIAIPEFLDKYDAVLKETDKYSGLGPWINDRQSAMEISNGTENQSVSIIIFYRHVRLDFSL